MADIFNVDRTNNTITLGTTDTVTNLPFLTASKILALDGSKNIVSTDLNSWVAGTANQITVTDDGDGTITLSAPQAIGTGSSPTFVALTLSAGPLDLSGKLTAGAWGSPIDVTNTRKYGFELHYSGNNYDVFGIRSRANLITTANSSTKTATGAELQAANSNGISVNVLCGAKCSSTGKSTANSATISYMRGVDIITEWGAKDTVTNLYNTHLKCITRTTAGEGSFGTGYGIYLENIAVGGTGQPLDAGIRFQETGLAGVEGFTCGIDFRGGTYTTAELICSSGTYINGSDVTSASTDTSDPKFCLKTTNTAHEVCFQLDESATDDHVDFKGLTASVNTRFHVIAQTDKSAYMGVQQGSYRGELILGAGGHLTLQNAIEDMDIVLKIDDGGTAKTITWDADVDKLKHSNGTFDFDNDHLTTTGNLTAGNYTAAALLTACATNAGALDFSAASKTLTVENDAVVSQDYSSDATPTFANLLLTTNLGGGANGSMLDVSGANLKINYAVFLNEVAAGYADIANFGQIWVKNTTPNQLWFTDDAGSDFQLGTAFGEYTDEDDDTATLIKAHAYLANQDGIVTAYATVGDAGEDMAGYIGTDNDPAGNGDRVALDCVGGTNYPASITFPVASGKYFEITGAPAITIWWHPIGTLIKPTDQEA